MAAFAACVKDAACACFVRERAVPRKPWISEGTWSTMRGAVRMRHYLRGCAQGTRSLVMAFYLLAWRAVASRPHDDAAECSAGLAALADRALARLDRRAALHLSALRKLMRLRRPLVRRDKSLALDERAAEAQRAADAGHGRRLYGMVRSLAGRSPAPLKGIQDTDGRFAVIQVAVDPGHLLFGNAQTFVEERADDAATNDAAQKRNAAG